LDLTTAALILLAGIVAGIINAIAGSGTLVTFPTLLALGVPPVVANVSNTVGLVPASVTAAIGFRHDLKGDWGTVAKMAIWSAVGGLIGAGLLLLLPSESFSAVVPFLLLAAAVLAAIQPRVARFVRSRSDGDGTATLPLSVGLIIGVLLTGVYGGYFGAAQGVILLALLGVLWSTDMNKANGAKNVLAGVANVVSAVAFIASGTVDWAVAIIIGIGAGVGGWLGAKIGRRIPAVILRMILVVIALVAAIVLFVNNL
jgi:uncharacterized membrane protein YfcA